MNKNSAKQVEKELRVISFVLQKRRRELGFTQEELAEKLDISVSAVQRIEQGVRCPSLPMLIRITRTLRMELALVKK